jgi:DNA-binding MarR family transcriptional regulator
MEVSLDGADPKKNIESPYRGAIFIGMSPRDAPRRQSQDADIRAGAALHALVTGAVRRVPREMSLTSLSTLSTLDRSGPRRITDLAVVEGIAQPSMTVLVSGLERSGLVERRADPTDGRVALIAMTDAGSDYIRARRRAGAEAFVQLIDKLSDDEVAALAAAIPALEHLRALNDEEREPPVRAPGRRSEGQG